MEPRALDNGKRRKRSAVVALVVALASQAGAASLRDVRVDVKSREGYTRTVIELTEPTEFFHRDFLASRRYFVVDIYRISPAAAERFITPETGPVQQILVLNRRGKDNVAVLTLVFYLTETRPYRAFSVQEPFRIVIDVLHGREDTAAPPAPLQATPTPVPLPARGGKKIVIIDPGHGGSDPGAQSYVKIGGQPVEEKDINLSVALQLKRLIDASPNMTAVLTRTGDTYVSLDDRVRFCERFYGEHQDRLGDLFVSVHCNASDSWRSRGARGIEFYYLNPNRVAQGSMRYLEQLENRNGGKNGNGGSDSRQRILKTLAAERLAKWLEEARIVCRHLRDACFEIAYYRQYNNREAVIQSAFFQVLRQAEMPAVLVEIGFLTNTYDCKQLVDAQFQQQVVRALYKGIISYFASRDQQWSAE